MKQVPTERPVAFWGSWVTYWLLAFGFFGFDFLGCDRVLRTHMQDSMNQVFATWYPRLLPADPNSPIDPNLLADPERSGVTVVRVEKLTVYLQTVLDRLAAQSPVRGIPARVYVRALDEWAGGADSSSDANIFVNLGTIRQIENEDEVAAILGHELSHVILRHHSSDMVEDLQSRALLLTGLTMAVHTAVLRRGIGSGADLQTHATAGAQEATLLRLTQRIVGPAWNRAQEREADLLGADLMVKAGYDPHAFETMLDKQVAAEGQQPNDESLEALAKQTVGGMVPKDGSGIHLTSASVQSGLKAGMGALMDRLSRAHPSTQERKQQMAAYLAREYGAVTRSPVRVRPWQQATEESSVRAIMRNYASATDAAKKLAQSEIDAADKLASKAVQGDTRDHAYTLTTLAAVRCAQQRRDQAAQSLRPGLSSREPAWAVYRDAARIDLQTGHQASAVATLEQGYKLLSEPPEAIPYLLFAYQAAGRKDDAAKLAASCLAKYPKRQLQGYCKAEAVLNEPE